ncbi:MAG TPA: histidine kinase dimerization/phospho-acceptor domain-containing protein [Xanthomonadaceae bacterium]|nr:histidine kinase dimerization/phospho-acceptor domain-containing protein [Xanthomonadaceae bacterium]
MNTASGNPSGEWLDRVAHDLRGPLMPLQTAAYLLRSGQLDAARQQELVEVIERQTRQLSRMIDELGDWMRAGQQRLLGHRESCMPALLLDYAATGAGLPPAIIEDRSDGAEVPGDAQRLTQLLRILLGYASTQGGVPRVRIAREGKGVRIDVAATRAPDAPPATTLLDGPQAHAFDGGLGLQLLLARAIAAAHGGTLQATDEGEDVRLRCELPLADDAAA